MFGERIAELRRRHGLSQQEVANLLGVTRQTVSNWECGQGAPTIDKAMALARTFHMSLDELVDPDFDVDAGQPPEGPAPEPASPVASLSLKLVDDADSVRILASDKTGAIAYEARAAKSPLGPRDFAVRDESGRRVGSLARRTTTFMGFDMTRVAIKVSGFHKVEAVRDMEHFTIAYRLDGEGLSLTSRSDSGSDHMPPRSTWTHPLSPMNFVPVRFTVWSVKIIFRPLANVNVAFQLSMLSVNPFLR